MPYPPRPAARVRSEWRGSASPRPDRQLQQRVEDYVVEQYASGRSLRVIAEETDRSFSAVRNILQKRGVCRRAPRVPSLADEGAMEA